MRCRVNPSNKFAGTPYPNPLNSQVFTCIHQGGERHLESKVSCPRTQGQWKITGMQNGKDCTISGAVNLPDLTGEELHLITKVTEEQDVT